MLLDIRTLYLIYTITSIANLWVIVYIWRANRNKFEGIGFLVLDFALQLVSMFLIMLRGHIPDFLSIAVSNIFSASGIWLSLLGLQKFFQQPVRIWRNILSLLVYSHLVFFSLFQENATGLRSLFYALIASWFFIQTIYLLMYRIPKGKRLGSRPALLITWGFLLVNLIRSAYYLFHGIKESPDYMNSGGFEAFIIVSYNLLFVLLTFSFVLLINRHLLQKVEKQEEKFTKVFQSSPHAILLNKISDGRIVEVNNGFEKLSGFSAVESIGKTTLDLGLWGESSARTSYLETLKKQGHVRNKECVFFRKGAIPFKAAISSDFIEWDGEEFVLSTIEDLSDLNRLVEELKFSTQELSRLNATKDKFFSIIAHDLRNPISQITALTELMHEDMARKDYSEAEQLAQMIHTSSERAMGLLSNLLEWSRLQTGRISFNPLPNFVGESVKLSLDLYEELIRKKEIELRVNIEDNLKAIYDRNMIETVIRNLVSNAIKFVQKCGTIEVNAWKENAKVFIAVKDNGIGVPTNKQELLFSIEGNYSTRGTMNEEGTGLGLVLCKEFVERHNGKISLISSPGNGSEFRFFLPLS